MTVRTPDHCDGLKQNIYQVLGLFQLAFCSVSSTPSLRARFQESDVCTSGLLEGHDVLKMFGTLNLKPVDQRIYQLSATIVVSTMKLASKKYICYVNLSQCNGTKRLPCYCDKQVNNDFHFVMEVKAKHRYSNGLFTTSMDKKPTNTTTGSISLRHIGPPIYGSEMPMLTINGRQIDQSVTCNLSSSDLDNPVVSVCVDNSNGPMLVLLFNETKAQVAIGKCLEANLTSLSPNYFHLYYYDSCRRSWNFSCYLEIKEATTEAPEPSPCPTTDIREKELHILAGFLVILFTTASLVSYLLNRMWQGESGSSTSLPTEGVDSDTSHRSDHGDSNAETDVSRTNTNLQSLESSVDYPTSKYSKSSVSAISK